MNDHITLTSEIPETLDGLRLDQAVAKLLPAYSRSRLQQWIKSGQVTLDGNICKPRELVSTGQTVVIDATLEKEIISEAQPIDLNIVFEDEYIIVIDKPVGLVVHPGAGNPDQTLLNALLHHAPELATVPRAGIIHRLDKDTSGLLVIAKTLPAHHQLVAQMQARSIKRQYICLVQGEIIAGGSIDAPIGRHPKARTKMSVIRSGKPAITHYRVKEKFRGYTLLDVTLESGRTHQIRVHMAHIHHSVVGDPLYGGRPKCPTGLTEDAIKAIQSFPRQALHAVKLGLEHPITQEYQAWESPLPDDIKTLLTHLPNGNGGTNPS